MHPIQTVLHPTDFSARSEAALQLAASLARDHGARLVVVHVAPEEVLPAGPAVIPVDWRQFRGQLEDIRTSQEGSGLRVPLEVTLRQGDPAEETLRTAGDVDADLIVMGTHGRSGLGRVLMGSVAEGILRRARCPVLTVRDALHAAVPPSTGAGSSPEPGATPEGKPLSPIRVILHPTDFSEDSAEAFQVACDLAHDYNSRLIALHVEPSELVYSGYIGGPTPDLNREELWTRLRRLGAADASVLVEPILAQGGAAAEILRVAAETGSDLIVIGTRGRTGIDRLLIGSVAEAVLRGANCPVLTVRSRRPEASDAPPVRNASGAAPQAV